MSRQRDSRTTAWWCALVVVAWLVLRPVAAGAQAPDDESPAVPTRTEELIALRRAKAEALEPNEPARAEVLLLYVEDSRLLERIFNPAAGWFVQAGGLSEGSLLALGGGYRIDDSRGGATDLRALGSIGGAWLADLQWHSDRRRENPVAASVGVAVERHANQQFFGLGPDATPEFDSDFDLDERRAGAAFMFRPTGWLTVGASGGFARFDPARLDLDFDDEDDVLGVELLSDDWSDVDLQVRQYVEGAIPALGERTRFTHAGVDLVIDRRDDARRPGWYVEAGRRWYRDADGRGYDFSATRVDVQRFLPVWRGERIVALRLRAEQVAAADGSRVPFYLQPTLGGSRSLRGYERQRFRDTNALLLQAEYRYVVNPFVSGALFAEAGQVAPAWRAMRADRLRGGVGFGLRAGYRELVVLRADVAFGGEGPRLIVALSGVF